jgi:hypothetical protein
MLARGLPSRSRIALIFAVEQKKRGVSQGCRLPRPHRTRWAAAEPMGATDSSGLTSVQQRVDHAKAHGKTADLEAASDGSAAGSQAAAGLEESLWLCPVEDRRELGSTREGMIPGFSLGCYIKLLDYSGRLFREGKATISAELAEIFERLGCIA